MMMNMSKNAASRVARVVVTKGESSLQRGLSTRSALGFTQGGNMLAVQQVMKLPVRQLVSATPKRQVSASDEFVNAPKTLEITPDMKAVAAATIKWKNTVTLNTEDAPKKTAALYHPTAVFWGTVSEQVRDTPQQVYEYFDFFARVPKLRMIEYNPSPPRVHGDFAIHGGDYTFAWQGADGATVEVLARFTFAYRKENGEWHIVEHHSSKMPDAPPALKAVTRE